MKNKKKQFSKIDLKKDLDIFDIGDKFKGAKENIKKAKGYELPDEVKAFYLKECLFFTLPAVFGVGAFIALGEIAVFVLGLIVSLLCQGVLAYGYITAKAQGVTIKYGRIEDYKKLKGVMGYINRGQDAINPLNYGRGKEGKRYGLNTSKYVVKMDSGVIREILIPTTNSPIPLGSRVKIYLRKESGGLNEAIHVEQVTEDEGI